MFLCYFWMLQTLILPLDLTALNHYCRGAFGVVHRCVEKSTGETFVAKFVNTPDAIDKQVIRNEVQVMNQLHHPRLLNLHDAFEDNHEMVLILE